MYLKITFTDGTEAKEYYESYRVREGLLILDQGGYRQPSKHINMAVVKSFEEWQE